MKESDHLVFGIISSATLSVGVFNPEMSFLGDTFAFVSFAAIGSLLPNIDTPRSIAGKYVEPLAEVIDLYFGHRSITHDPLFLLPLFVLSILIGNPIFFAIMFGVMGHLLLDASTFSGIPVACLFTKQRIWVLPKRFRMMSDSTLATVATWTFCGCVIFIWNALGGGVLINNLSQMALKLANFIDNI